MKKLKILVIDSNPIIYFGLKAIFKNSIVFEISSYLDNKDLLIESITEEKIDFTQADDTKKQMQEQLKQTILKDKQKEEEDEDDEEGLSEVTKASIRKAEEEYEKSRQERIKRLNESAKSKLGADVFEGTKQITEGSSHSALSGVSPADSGIDITNIEKLSKGRWKHLI